MKPSAKSEIRAVVWVLFVEKVSTMKIHCQLAAIYGENVMSVQMIHKWHQQFKAG